MHWSRKRPNLNPVENVSGVLVKATHAKRKQFSDVGELEDCVMKEWASFTPIIFYDLNKSMAKR